MNFPKSNGTVKRYIGIEFVILLDLNNLLLLKRHFYCFAVLVIKNVRT